MRIGSMICTVIAAAGALALPACHSPKGGIMPYTGGSFTYYSTETQPKTVRIVDQRNNEEVFAMDIPPGKQLTFDFVEGKGDDPVYTPDLLRWELFPMGTMTGGLRNSMTVPNAASRKIIVELREGIEYAPGGEQRPQQTDQAKGKPDWWSPEGGPVPEEEDDAAMTLYDN
mgnify:CR=1 FL=1